MKEQKTQSGSGKREAGSRVLLSCCLLPIPCSLLLQIGFWMIWAFGALYFTYLLLRAAQKVLKLLVCWGRFGKKFAEFAEWERRRNVMGALRCTSKFSKFSKKDRRRNRNGGTSL